MSILFEAVEPLSNLIEHFNRYDEDGVDRLNHKYSTMVFCLLAIIVTANQYVGEVIKCWSPAQFPDSWVEYANWICWTSNTYFIPMEQFDVLKAPRKEIVYYQWVPFVLFIEAFMFYLPSIIWSWLSQSTGVNISKVAKFLRSHDHINPENREKTLKYFIKHLERSLKYSQNSKPSKLQRIKHIMSQFGCICGKRYGNYLLFSYTFTKLLYIGNAIAQLYLIHIFLGTEYMLYGVEVLRDIQRTGEFRESKHFPHVTLCDFTIRSLGRSMPHTVQCTLPINLFNEKIFLFVWFWLVLVLVFSVFSLVYWLWITFTNDQLKYIKTIIKLFDKYQKEDKKKLRAFCKDFIRLDGYFILRMISKNTNDVIAAEIVCLLWRNFSNKYEERKKHCDV